MTEPTVLVLGGGGMLGHRVVRSLMDAGVPVACTLRHGLDDFPPGWRDLFQKVRVVPTLDAADAASLQRVLRDMRPAAVVNCVGVIKQRSEGADELANISVNSLVPHLVARSLAEWQGRLVHISTDCVFGGEKGGYAETDSADARDLYGLSKILGEPHGDGVLVLRTSMVGREIRHRESLLEWLISRNHTTVRGFRRMYWSGVTNIYLAGLITDLLTSIPPLEGLFHVAGERVSKLELLEAMRDAFGLDVEIVPDDSVVLDRSLDGTKFRTAVGRQVPPIRQLLVEAAADPGPYPSIS